MDVNNDLLERFKLMDEEDNENYKELDIKVCNSEGNEDELLSPYTIVPEEDDSQDKFLSKIIIRNTTDLTLEGARRLCQPYGKINSVNRPPNRSEITFVQFANSEDAKCAVESLNSMFGFEFRAEICIKRDDLNSEKVGVLPKFEMRRQYPGPFLPPISITYPTDDTLISDNDYENHKLESVDPDKVFCVTDWMPFKRGGFVVDFKATKLLIERLRVQMKNEVQCTEKKNVFMFKGLSEDMAKQFSYGYCIKCEKKALSQCTACQDFYCSAECQRSDWPKHKLICGKPIEEKLEEDIPNEPKSTNLRSAPFPERNSTVLILSAINPWTIFIRSLEDVPNREYLKIIDECVKEGTTAETLQKRPRIGEIVLASYENRGFHRALVLRNNDLDVNVVYIDLGYYAKVKVCELRLLQNSELKFRKIHIHRILLKGVDQNLEDHENAMVKLNKFLESHKFELKYQEGDKDFTLISQSSGENLSKVLNSIMDITAIPSDTREFIDYQTDVQQSLLPCGQKIKILITTRSTFPIDGSVSCILYDNLSYLKNLEEKIQKYAASKKIAEFTTFFTPNPTVQEFCLAEIGEKWYRCSCLETFGDGRPTLLLVDYGNIFQVPYEKIRKIPKKFVIPVVTIDCMVHGFMEKKAKGLEMNTEFMDKYIPLNTPIEVETLKDKIDNRMELTIKIDNFFNL